MDKQIWKLKKLIERYLYQSKQDIKKIWGAPLKCSDNEVWFYFRYNFIFFKDEVSFIFEKDKVVDIVFTQYFLRIELRQIFYYENETPEYKVITLI